MALKNFSPITPSLRQLVLVDRSELWKGKPVKSLTEGLTKSGGRNNTGRITARRIGGGHKRRYRLVDFKRRKFDVPAVIERLEYDPNRTAFIALVRYEDGEQAYILAPQRLKVGDSVIAGERVDVKPGNAMPLKNIPVGTIVHNVELKPGKGGQLARSAGTYVQLVGRDQGYAQLRWLRASCAWCRPSASRRSARCPTRTSTNINLGKAGRKRWLGNRPSRPRCRHEPGRPPARRW